MPTSHPESRSWMAARLSELSPGLLLDVGPGDGTYGRMARETVPTCRLEAVEVWPDYVARYKLGSLYDQVHVADVRTWSWPYRYDVVVAGDVLEHMTRDEAAAVVAAAKQHADAMLVTVPIVDYPQHGHDNPHETHVVSDWRHDQMVDMLAPDVWWCGDIVGAYLWRR